MKDTDYIWQSGVITEHQHQRWIEFPRLTACARCRVGQGCGAGIFALFFAGRTPRLRLPHAESWSPGDGVRVGISSGQLMWSSGVLYLFPLLCFMLGIGLSERVIAPGQDLFGLISGLLAAAAALVLVRRHRWRFDSLRIEAMPEAATGPDPVYSCSPGTD